MRNSWWTVMLVASGLLAGCPWDEIATDDDGGSADACATVRCAAGTHCEETPVQCIKAPCPAVVECVDDDTSDITCANVRCSAGTTCVDTPKGPVCQPTDGDGGSAGCAAVLCMQGTFCIEGPNGPECVSKEPGAICGDTVCPLGEVCCNASCGICAPPDGACIQIACEPEPVCEAECEAGTHCELMEVQCFAPPCDPVPTCVDDTVYGCELMDCQIGYTCVEDEKGSGACVPQDACAEHTCEEGQHCELLFPPCAPPPEDQPVPPDYCRPIPACVDNQTCAAASCPVDTTCDDSTGRIECIPQGGESCAAALCPIDTYCDDISGKVECIPLPSCNTVKCSAGHHCELQDVVCVRAPCPPLPACVPDDPCANLDCANCKVVDGKAVCGGSDECDDPCAAVRCKAGTHCEAQQILCITTPCCPIAECVADEPVYGCELIDCKPDAMCVEDAQGNGSCVPSTGPDCGSSTCAAGQVCCNASCGICTPPDGVCIQLACDPKQ